ncbi:cyanophycinase [Persicobacter diffluens]|uniref:Cyanophycinase n=1 Tax=Persicobacter diffluens TaxID=981 RepID=A0AAN4VWR2_9BACT|nr:hypothetical protein PEDI_19830 [Persicobacter diffluens]
MKLLPFWWGLIFLFSGFNVLAQGSLLLVGGGSEQHGGWSDAPYQWFVQQAENKKVAIISYAPEEDSWLSQYFVSLGAAEARHFQIDASNANEASLIEQLSSFDAFFFKGGDQWKYYRYYQASRFADWLRIRFEQGAAIGGTSAGMAILGEWDFTAENGSLLPVDGMENLDARYFRFQKELLPCLPGFITDTHFAERGRLPRMLSMLGYMQLRKGVEMWGVGVDDRTALMVDATGVGTVSGTGAVTFAGIAGALSAEANSPLKAESFEIVSLVQNQKFDLKTKEVVTQFEKVYVSVDQSFINREMALVGNLDDANVNQKSIVFLNNIEGKTLVFAKNNFFSEGSLEEEVHVLDHEWPEGTRKWLPEITKIVLATDDYAAVAALLEDDNYGPYLQALLKTSSVAILAGGASIKFVGDVFCNNLRSRDDHAYRGNLKFEQGLGLLPGVMLMDAFLEEGDFAENEMAAYQYGLWTHSLSRVISLDARAFIKTTIVDDQLVLEVPEGAQSLWVVEAMDGGYLPDANSNRQIISFAKMKASMRYGELYPLGSLSENDDPARPELPEAPTPLNSIPKITDPLGAGEKYWQLYDEDGRLVKAWYSSDHFFRQPVVPAGLYIVNGQVNGQYLEGKIYISKNP